MASAQSRIFNYCDVSERIAIGGQPAIHQFGLLKDAGKQVVFQLVVEEARYSASDEAYHVEQMGLIHESMEVSFAAPTDAKVEYFMNVINQHHAKPIYIHCAAGYCTSGLMVIYLMKTLQMSFDAATQLVVPGWYPQPSWLQLIQTMTGLMI